MKKLVYISLFCVVVLSSATSCRKCVICTKSSSPEVRICEKDYSSKTEYGFAVDLREAGGYECR